MDAVAVSDVAEVSKFLEEFARRYFPSGLTPSTIDGEVPPVPSDARTALMSAAEVGKASLVGLLAEFEASFASGLGETALILAAGAGHADCVSILAPFEAQQSTTIEAGCETALIRAVRRGHTACAEALVDFEAGLCDASGLTACVHAARLDRGDLCALLAPSEAGCIFGDSCTALMAAVLAKAHSAVVALAPTPDAGIVTTAGLTALMLAVLRRDEESVRILAPFEAGFSSPEGQTALMLSVETSFDRGVALLADSADARLQRAADGATALILAVKRSDVASVRLLVPQEAGIQLTEGSTALMVACDGDGGEDNAAIIALLAESTTPTDVGLMAADGVGALMISAEKGNVPGVRALIGFRAELDAVDVSGSTPLSLAEQHGHNECAELIRAALAAFSAAPDAVPSTEACPAPATACSLPVASAAVTKPDAPSLLLPYEPIVDVPAATPASNVQPPASRPVSCLAEATETPTDTETALETPNEAPPPHSLLSGPALPETSADHLNTPADAEVSSPNDELTDLTDSSHLASLSPAQPAPSRSPLAPPAPAAAAAAVDADFIGAAQPESELLSFSPEVPPHPVTTPPTMLRASDAGPTNVDAESHQSPSSSQSPEHLTAFPPQTPAALPPDSAAPQLFSPPPADADLGPCSPGPATPARPSVASGLAHTFGPALMPVPTPSALRACAVAEYSSSESDTEQLAEPQTDLPPSSGPVSAIANASSANPSANASGDVGSSDADDDAVGPATVASVAAMGLSVSAEPLPQLPLAPRVTAPSPTAVSPPVPLSPGLRRRAPLPTASADGLPPPATSPQFFAAPTDHGHAHINDDVPETVAEPLVEHHSEPGADRAEPQPAPSPAISFQVVATWSNLMAAAALGDADAVAALVQYEARRCAARRPGANEFLSALFLAVQASHLPAAKLLAPVEAMWQQPGTLRTALMEAACRGDVPMVKLLAPLERGLRDAAGLTALMLAVSKGQAAAVLALIPHEAGLSVAAAPPVPEGADLAIPVTALTLASERRFFALVDLLTPFEGPRARLLALPEPIPQFIARRVRRRAFHVLKRMSPLMAAAADGRLSAIYALCRIQAGFCWCPPDRTGSVSALMLAAGCSDADNAVLALLPFETLYVNELGETALMRAAAAGNASAVKHLAPFETGIISKSGVTALSLACLNGHVSCIPFLADEVSVPDANGLLPVDVADTAGHADVVAALRRI
jgi:ankyrin repeat protein